MNQFDSQWFSRRLGMNRPLASACAVGLLALGLASGVWAGSVPAGAIGGQGGATGNAVGGAAGNGGQGGEYHNVAGSIGGVGSKGKGGAGGSSGTEGQPNESGGNGGNAGLIAKTTSTVSGVSGQGGGNGNGLVAGGFPYYNSGGGGGGGGDGVYVYAGVTITNSTGTTITGGNGGDGGPGHGYTHYYGGSGGGGGNGVEFAGAGTLVNQGIITGGAGGGNGDSYGYQSNGPSGSGGGHGVVGAGITITNSGTIAGGAVGALLSGRGTHGSSGTAGDAILFTGADSYVTLLSGSTISGNIELATGANAEIYSASSGQTLSSNIVLDDNTRTITLNTSTAGLTVSGVISGVGGLQVAGSSGNPLILSAANTFTGGTTINSGLLQVDGSIGDVYAGSGTLGGVGTVGNITLSSSGTVAPGDSVGTLNGTSLTWNGGGAFDFQLGATNSTTNTDLLTLTGALAQGSAGTYKFHFTDGNGGPPQTGMTYTLITFASSSGFTTGSFTYDYTGADPTLIGAFNLTANALTFTVSAMPVTLQSFEVD